MNEAEHNSSGRPDRLAFTPAEIAAAAGLSRKAIYRAIENGELRAAKVCNGSRLLIPPAAAREWIEMNLVEPRQRPATGRSPRSDRNGGRVLARALQAVETVSAEG